MSPLASGRWYFPFSIDGVTEGHWEIQQWSKISQQAENGAADGSQVSCPESEERASKGMRVTEYPTEKYCIFFLWVIAMVCIVK